MMRKTSLAVVLGLALVLGPLGCAAPDYDTLVKQFEDAQQKWWEDYQKAREEQAKQQGEEGATIQAVDMTDLPQHPAEAFVGKFEACARRCAGKPEAIPALAWIISNARSGGNSDESQKDSPAKSALCRLTEDHAAQVEVKDALPGIRYAMYTVGQEGLVTLYERIIEANEDKEAKAGATFNLAFTLSRSGGMGDTDEKKVEADKKRAEALFRRLVSEYPDAKVTERAAGYIFELENLQIGMVAPDFTGTDADEKEIKLSQFRGQVVVLDFWGFW